MFPLPLDHPEVQVVLAREELVDATDTESGLGGNVTDGGGVIPAFAEHAFRGFEEARKIGLAVAGTAA